MPTPQDMTTSLHDARFFLDKLEPIVRGPENEQDLEAVRRFFRAFLHCWKCVLHYVREEKGLQNTQGWVAWCGRWQQALSANERAIFDVLRNTRDHDTHVGTIHVAGEVAAGVYPIVMFEPGKRSGPQRELISCCESGLSVAERLIRDYPDVQ